MKKMKPTCNLISQDGSAKKLGYIDVPIEPSPRPWVLPSEKFPKLPTKNFFSNNHSRLEDYGYGVRAGYFVWNREKHRYREAREPIQNEYPLVWARGVKSNKPCQLTAYKSIDNEGCNISFVRFDNSKKALIFEPVIVLQRTTNKNQPRRIIAGYVTKAIFDKYGAITTENHTIVIYPLSEKKQKLTLEELCVLLNSKPVDLRYRQVSGTVNISVKILKELPLPRPEVLRSNIKMKNLSGDEIDDVIEGSY